MMGTQGRPKCEFPPGGTARRAKGATLRRLLAHGLLALGLSVSLGMAPAVSSAQSAPAPAAQTTRAAA
ncbi:MAG: hypothetical protein WBF84_03680, partial [Castellaniella sp.]